MSGNIEQKIASHDPWIDLLRQTAVVNVPLEQVFASLAVPRPEAVAAKDELMEHLIKILEEADQAGVRS